jgi:hypothetical protein
MGILALRYDWSSPMAMRCARTVVVVSVGASQLTVQKTYPQLLKEIDTVLSAIGFRAFEDEKQSELQELSEAVRAESGKLVPNTINVGAAAGGLPRRVML